MTERAIEGPVQRIAYQDDLVERGELFVGSDGKVTQYVEEFADGVFSVGWHTEMPSDSALEALSSSELAFASEAHDIELASDGSWSVSTEEGSFFVSIDPSGSVVAGVVTFEGGISEESIAAWRDITSPGDR